MEPTYSKKQWEKRETMKSGNCRTWSDQKRRMNKYQEEIKAE